MLLPLRAGILAAAVAVAQGAPTGPAIPPPAQPPLAWSAVSIHVSDPDRPGQNYSNDQANGITDRGMGLREVISQGFNFDVMPFREDEVVGLPSWALTTRYDIVARVGPEDVEAFKKLSNLSMAETVAAFSARQPTGEMLMMQSLLAERFHLKAHGEMKERAVYRMGLAKGGLRMKPAADPKHGEMSFDRGHLAGKGVPLSFLASLLSMPAGRKVVDGTGASGVFDFDLRFDPGDGPSATNSSDPDLFTAVQEQLGLKLQSTRATVPVLVVDHVEQPTDN